MTLALTEDFDFFPFVIPERDGDSGRRKVKLALRDDNKVVIWSGYVEREAKVLKSIYEKVGLDYAYGGEWYCGYVAFPLKDVPDDMRDCYTEKLSDVVVHGGMTYCETHGDYIVFGFDCAHAGDESNPKVHDPKWVMDETTRMECQLRKAFGLEK